MKLKNIKTSTAILSLNILALLSACGHSGGSSATAPTSASVEPAVQAVSTSLTQDDLKIIGDADSGEINTYYSSNSSFTSSTGLSNAFVNVFADIPDLSAEFSSIDSCTTTSSANGTTVVTLNCSGAVGTVTNVFNLGSMSTSETVSLQITGTQSSASIDHVYQASMFNSTSSRSINDTIHYNTIQLALTGSAQMTRSIANSIDLSATYQVIKNSGAAETITVTSQGLLSGTCGLNSGTITYATSSLSYTVTLAACPVIAPPPIIVPPIIIQPINIM